MLRQRIQEFERRVEGFPASLLILLGFLISYLLLFVGPIFLGGTSMQRFETVPAAAHLGIDLRLRLSWSAYSLDPGLQVPDGDGTVFPPLANLLFVPLLALSFPAAYALLTALTVLLYVLSTLWLPALNRRKGRLSPVAVLICVTGLVSYGLQFEIERGQWNVIAVFFALLAVWIFHAHERARILAYALLVIAVQLKVYPIVFAALLVSDWHLWKVNILRFAMLAAANVLLFFAQGMRALEAWISGLKDWSASTWIWEGNPSIRSAVTLAADFGSRYGWDGFASNAGWIQSALSIGVLLCLAAILLRTYRHQQGMPGAYYVLAAAISCLLIPSGGYDYRLTILGAPLVMVLHWEEHARNVGGSLFSALGRKLAVIAVSLAYATTLVPYSQKPYYLANNFPALFVMLLLVTYLALTMELQPTEQASPVERYGNSAV